MRRFNGFSVFLQPITVHLLERFSQTPSGQYVVIDVFICSRKLNLSLTSVQLFVGNQEQKKKTQQQNKR